jgi:hypothetical protein
VGTGQLEQVSTPFGEIISLVFGAAGGLGARLPTLHAPLVQMPLQQSSPSVQLFPCCQHATHVPVPTSHLLWQHSLLAPQARLLALHSRRLPDEISLLYFTFPSGGTSCAFAFSTRLSCQLHTPVHAKSA